MRTPPRIWIAFVATALLGGCQTFLIDAPDRRVYDLVEERQKDALGETHDINIGPESGEINEGNSRERMYSFTPRPVDSEIPDSFNRPKAEEPIPTDVAHAANEPHPQPIAPEPMQEDSQRKIATDEEALAAQSGDPQDVPQITPEIYAPADAARVRVFNLRDALAFAMRNAREYQDAKEDLYLAGLDLTLERHLWTPQFVAAVQADFANYGQIRDFDRAMSVTSEVAMTQRLPYGGQVAARVINRLMRDLGVHTTSGESGNVILEADIPLLRGAGKVAYESRYREERELIYAVRTFERFRREFLTLIAAEYFNLQQLRAAIYNTFKSYESRRRDWERADFVNRMGQSKSIFEAPRARASYRQSEAALVSAKERYQSAIDRFKIRMGMPVGELLDVTELEADQDAAALDDLLPDVELDDAERVALKYRLDLLNVADAVDDSRRGVVIAKNAILPNLNASGSLTLDSEPGHLSSTHYDYTRMTWRGSVRAELNDRYAERNAYRASLVALRKAERDYELAQDNVRADVRRAVRRIAQQANLRAIQEQNVEENELRVAAARAQEALGKINNRDVVEAENDVLAARNDLAAAIAAYRVAVLEFRRDTGTLRVDDDGQWARP